MPLAVCAKGWLFDQPNLRCDAACAAGTPECKESDCYEKNVEGYLTDGVLIDVTLSISQTLGTMSTVTDYTKRRYEITETGIKMTPSAVGVMPAECRGGVLSLQGEPYSAVPVAFSSALDAQMATGQLRWSGVKIAR